MRDKLYVGDRSRDNASPTKLRHILGCTGKVGCQGMSLGTDDTPCFCWCHSRKARSKGFRPLRRQLAALWEAILPWLGRLGPLLTNIFIAYRVYRGVERHAYSSVAAAVVFLLLNECDSIKRHFIIYRR